MNYTTQHNGVWALVCFQDYRREKLALIELVEKKLVEKKVVVVGRKARK